MHHQWPEEAVGGRGAYFQEMYTPAGEMQDMKYTPLQEGCKI